ncbi:hypothetical protein LXL04_038065 [Taraxacum kok-saghyz]
MPVVIANDAVAPSSLRTMIEGLISGTIESLNGLIIDFYDQVFPSENRSYIFHKQRRHQFLRLRWTWLEIGAV